MKQVISLFILAILVSPYTAPTFAQKGRPATLKATPAREVSPKKSTISRLPQSTEFRSIGAFTDNNGVYIAWEMEAEVGNIGFNVYRLDKEGSQLLNAKKIVAGSAMHAREVPTFGESYSFFDPNGNDSAAYYVEAQSLRGQNVRSREIYPQYISDLKSISGKTSAQLSLEVESPSSDVEHTSLSYTKDLLVEMEETHQIADPATHRTVISQPGVVRIGVKREGIHRISRAQLAAGGFNVNTDSSLWQLYVDGVQQSMIIGGNGDYIEFYGKGIDLPETDTKQYFLLNGSSPGKRMETRVARRGTSSVVTQGYAQTFVKKERTNYVDDVDNGDAENYFGRAIAAGFQTINFNLSGVDTTSPTSRFYVQFMGYSFDYHIVEMILNDVALAPLGGPPTGPQGEGSFGADYEIPTSLLREGANTLKVRAIGPSDFIFFDQFQISFSRKYLADQNKLAFYTPNYRTAQLGGFSSADVRVFDVTRDGEPVLMTNLAFTQNGGTFGTEMPAARGRSFFAAEASSLISDVTITPTNPELVGLPTNGADLVIVYYKDFLPQAQAWANYRLSVEPQGFTVKIIEVSELYDEFNYGTHGAAGLQNFFQYAFNNWQIRPKYALLIGDASADPRNYENLGNWNMVPSKMMSAIFSETASDESLTDFDEDSLSEIPIGRIASRDAVGITNVLNKVIHWESQGGASLSRGALFAYDFNTGYDFDAMSHRIRAELPDTMPTAFVYRGEANANANLINALNAGKYIVNYSGHGTTGSWGGNPPFFNLFSVPTLEDDPNDPAIYTMLTCLNGAFHYLRNESFAEVLTKTSNRGAVAAWASTGLTLANIQEPMAIHFYGKISDGDIPRLGDLIRDSKSVLGEEAGGSDVRRSWALIGDPMLKVR